MDRHRLSALTVGATYVLFGLIGWLRLPPTASEPGGVIMFALWGAVAILAFGTARPELLQVAGRDAGPWLTIALAGPLALVPFHASDAPSQLAVAVLWPASALPLGIALGGSSERPDRTWLLALGSALLASLAGIDLALEGDPAGPLEGIRLGLVTAVALAPALAAIRIGPPPEALRAGRVLAGLAPLAGATVLVLPTTGLAVLATALVSIAVVSRLAVSPWTRAATRANAQRDLTVAIVEAERRRLAADIHDGPLQALLLLGRQLEERGETNAAADARAIAAELRDVAGELRLPVLDDLGLGPALDWLAGRVSRLSGIDVTVEYQGLQRPPPEVELAAFRIAQEALSNAIRHGEPPIVITYRTTGDSVSLAVDDAGRGFSTTIAGPSGSYGLLDMVQRAEQIGARLELQHRADRGMHVGIEWRSSPA